jgi:NAD(P)H-dependent FMN reductase
LKLSIIAGSHRPASASGKVARFIKELVESRLKAGFKSIYHLDLGRTALPLWDEGAQTPGAPGAPWDELWGDISAEFNASHAFVFVVPEWSGMAPPAVKNLLLLCDKNELAHKPALIVGISSGLGGAYPVAELRANSSKDTKVCYIPEQVIVRQVQHVLNSPEPRNKHDAALHERLSYSLTLLLEYAKALATVRESGVVNAKKFPYGM